MKPAALGTLVPWLNQFKPGAGQQQLVAVHNGYRLWLGLLALQADTPQLVAYAASSATDPVVAIAEARQSLVAQGGRPGKKVILLTSSALPALLDLPIDPDKPRKAAEMESMISWELENQVADHNEYYNLGAILCGRGLISAEQRQQITFELEHRRSQGNSLARFGEVAMDLGLLDQTQLQASLQLQEKLVVTDTRLVCGWQPQRLLRDDNAEYQWLVAGMSSRLRQQWHQAFASNGLKLTAILPLTGSAAPCALRQTPSGNLVLVEASQDCITGYRLERAQFAAWQTQPRRDKLSLAEQCQGMLVELLRADSDQVYLQDSSRAASASTTAKSADEGTEAEVEDAAARLGQSLQRQVDWLADSLPQFNRPGQMNSSSQALPDPVFCALVAAAMDRRGRGASNDTAAQVALPVVPAREPPPPWWKNLELYRYGVPLLLLLAMLGHGGYSLWLRGELQDQLDTLDSEYKRKLNLNKQIASISGDYQKKEQELQALSQEAQQVEAQLSQLSTKVMARTRLLPKLVKAIAVAVTNNVMLDALVEPRRDSRDRFNLTAWAVDNPSASEFTERLQQLVGRLGYRVADPDIRAGIGRYGLSGYTINLWLVPVSREPVSHESKEAQP